MSNELVNRKNIQWFPGHMMKTLRLIEADMKNVDVVLQLLDARIPHSSLNPEILALTANKPTLYVLNKADLADPAVTAAWKDYFKNTGAGCVVVNSKQKGSASTVKTEIDTALEELLQRRANKGMEGAKIRVMIVGIPNVGKSTFINNFAGEVRAKAADKPGVTRGKQWIAVGKYDLLDMPGVLWKKFDNIKTATNLAFIGSIKDDILDTEEIAMNLLGEMRGLYFEALIERYKLTQADKDLDDYELLEQIGRKRGMLISGGEVNTERASIMLLDEFRGSKFGRISLERPEDDYGTS
ncbi:MAG: ribosome biogenesis GTPase YlqF, partial [Oscillospiraceae bacterium]|nr:ribosome biogenesis GTPase YlqF [Oscillospiraceae bacterium]